MLVVISDLHLTDGTSSPSLTSGAGEIFAQELRDLAFQASFRSSDRYRPVSRVDVVLLGDILDPLRSAQWTLQPQTRPWHDAKSPSVAKLVTQITHEIVRYNEPLLDIFRKLVHGGGLTLPPADSHGRPAIHIPGEPAEVPMH